MGGCFHSSCNKYLLGAYCTWCCGGCGDESGSHSALGCVDSDSLNYGCPGSSKWLLIGVMRKTLWSGFLVLEALYGSVITLIKESWSRCCFSTSSHFSCFISTLWRNLSDQLHRADVHSKCVGCIFNPEQIWLPTVWGVGICPLALTKVFSWVLVKFFWDLLHS